VVADGSNFTKEKLAEIEVAFQEWPRDFAKRRAGAIADAQRALHDLRF
jgi:hypothetical protein